MSVITPKSAKAPAHPARTIAILALLTIALTTLAFFTSATKVKLALDLQGGTSVTLKPVVSAGGKVTEASINEAVGIIRNRVDSLGIAESLVTAEGNGAQKNIVIQVPGITGDDLVKMVGQTAELRFRQVLSEGAATVGKAGDTATAVAGVTPAINAAYAALDCAKDKGGTDNAKAIVVACSQQNPANPTGPRTKYILAAAEVVGADVNKAAAVLDQQNNAGWMVNLGFTGHGTDAFGKLTQRVTSLGTPLNQVAIVLDGQVVSAPRINEAILTGNAQITGSFTQARATQLANVLKYGALPLAFRVDSVDQVSATLGSDQLHAGLLAGGLGLLLVVLYSILYYRGLGLVSVGSLIVAAGITYLAVLLLGHYRGFTLSLAGIAGAIVSIGITADSFIVFFERLRDEVREGRSLRTAVETGWARATRTLIVADSVSIIAAIVLYLLSVSSVRGFAFTLGLTTLVDLIVVFFFTHPLVSILARVPYFAEGRPLSGFSAKSLGVVSKEA